MNTLSNLAVATRMRTGLTAPSYIALLKKQIASDYGLKIKARSIPATLKEAAAQLSEAQIEKAMRTMAAANSRTHG